MDNSHSEQSPTNREEVKKEKDINSETKDKQGDSMRILERVLVSAIGGGIVAIGLLFLLGYYASPTKISNFLGYGIIILIIGIAFIYFLAYKPR